MQDIDTTKTGSDDAQLRSGVHA